MCRYPNGNTNSTQILPLRFLIIKRRERDWGEVGRAPHRVQGWPWAVHRLGRGCYPPGLGPIQHEQRHHANQASRAGAVQPVREPNGPAQDLCSCGHAVPRLRVGSHPESLWVSHTDSLHTYLLQLHNRLIIQWWKINIAKCIRLFFGLFS